MRTVRLYHPELDAHMDAPEVSVHVHERSGWQRESLDDMTKADLLALAADRGIEGRSQMSKGDLVEALTTPTPTSEED